MSITKSLAKLHKAITGSAGKNTVAKNVEGIADAWAGLNASKIPTLPTLDSNGTKYFVLKVVKSSDGTTYTWDEKTFT